MKNTFGAGILLLFPFIFIVSFLSSFSHALAYGVDADGVEDILDNGGNITYGQMWIGAWNEKYGWDDTRRTLQQAKKNKVTPVIMWYYWGGEISPLCLRSGCDSQEGDHHKSTTKWNDLAEEAAEMIAQEMGTQEVIIVIEPEFNKNGVENDRLFDSLLSKHQKIFRSIPNAKIVAGFGGWNEEGWKNFPRSIAGSDYIGFQLLRSSIRNTPSEYMQSADDLLRFAQLTQKEFDKPSFITDVGLSSYPGPRFSTYQKKALKRILEKESAFEKAGVAGIIYRAVEDWPQAPLEEYHGRAERYWGLVDADGKKKPSFDVFVNGIKK